MTIINVSGLLPVNENEKYEKKSSKLKVFWRLETKTGGGEFMLCILLAYETQVIDNIKNTVQWANKHKDTGYVGHSWRVSVQSQAASDFDVERAW